VKDRQRKKKGGQNRQTPVETAPQPVVQEQSPSFQKSTLWISLALIALTVLIYAPVATHDFLNYDDTDYVSQNPDVAAGLTWHGVVWAFTTGHSSNWHPLTWLSHMLDVQLFGMHPGPHHVVNLLFHIANTILLFLLLYRWTGEQGRSAFVAALFAVHPLHVQSVAWVAERKDMLSTLFWLLTLWAYGYYVKEPRAKRYALVLAFLVCGLMSKPMLVTLPFTLLLLDFWPLHRATLEDRAKWMRLILEKAPMFLAVIASSVITFEVQQQARSVVNLSLLPLRNRVANAAISYFSYIAKMIWPSSQAVLYPYRRAIPDVWILAAAGFVAVSILVLWTAKRRPYTPVGWFWYVGTMIPVIGLIQVGAQSIADRYTYIPFIGLFIVVAWGIPDLLDKWPPSRRVLPIAAGLIVAACSIASARQVSFWKNSRTLWEQALANTRDNAFAEYNLGWVLAGAGKDVEAIPHLQEAVRIDSKVSELHKDLGSILARQGRTDEAIVQFSQALQIASNTTPPFVSELHKSLADALSKQGKPDEAIAHYRDAIHLNPQNAEAHFNLGFLFASLGKTQEAIDEYVAALRINPDHVQAHNNLGIALANQGKLEDALSQFSEVVRLRPNEAEFQNNLGSALARQGRFDEAARHFSEAVRINPAYTEARQNLAIAIERQKVSR
jgi:Flp pilus assembly protein TadD